MVVKCPLTDCILNCYPKSNRDNFDLDEVTRIPPGSELLATSDHTRVQALEIHHQKGVF